MQGIVEKLMRKPPEERYQSPRELIGAIEAYEAKRCPDGKEPGGKG